MEDIVEGKKGRGIDHNKKKNKKFKEHQTLLRDVENDENTWGEALLDEKSEEEKIIQEELQEEKEIQAKPTEAEVDAFGDIRKVENV